jgi:hypothetical protein
LKNNIFYTTQTSGGGANAKSYALGTEATTLTMANLTSDVNLFFFSGANAAGFRTGALGATGTDFANLAAWQTASGNDANSLFGDPLFVSPASDLHLSCGSPADNAGMPIPGITTDIDGEMRSATTPDIGADEAQAPTALNAVSRKTHGAAGDFDIDLPPSGPLGIECRSGGAMNDYQVVVTFASPVTLGSAAVTVGTGSVALATVSGNTITVDLTGVINQQVITVGLTCVSDGINSGNMTVDMGVLVGDTNGNGAVNAGDTVQTRGRSGQTTDATNFRSDVNLGGAINSGDQIAVRSRSGTALP